MALFGHSLRLALNVCVQNIAKGPSHTVHQNLRLKICISQSLLLELSGLLRYGLRNGHEYNANDLPIIWDMEMNAYIDITVDWSMLYMTSCVMNCVLTVLKH